MGSLHDLGCFCSLCNGVEDEDGEEYDELCFRADGRSLVGINIWNKGLDSDPLKRKGVYGAGL